MFDDSHYSLHKECLYNDNRWWRLGEKSSVAEISILRDSSIEISSLGITNCVDVVVASVAVGGTTTSTPRRLAFC